MNVKFAFVLALFITTQAPSYAQNDDATAVTEMQQTMEMSNNIVALRAVGRKYLNADSDDVSGCAHAALIAAHDVSEFTNVLAGLKKKINSPHYIGGQCRSLASLYIQESRAVRVSVSNELDELYSSKCKASDVEYRSELFSILSEKASDMVAKTWVQHEAEALLSVTDTAEFVRKGIYLINVMSMLADRGDEKCLDVIFRIRQRHIKQWDDYCVRAEKKYRIATSAHPENLLREAMASGDDSLEEWCIEFIHRKRMMSMLAFAEQRLGKTSASKHDWYVLLIHDLKNPERIKGPIGSRENPIIMSEQLPLHKVNEVGHKTGSEVLIGVTGNGGINQPKK